MAPKDLRDFKEKFPTQSSSCVDKISLSISNIEPKSSTVEEQLMTRQEVAAMCKVKSLTTLWAWQKRNILVPRFRAGRKPLYLKQDVLNFLHN